MNHCSGPRRVTPRRPSARTDPVAPFDRPLPTIDPVRLRLAGLFSTLGVQAVIGFIRNTLTGPWLDAQDIEERLSRPFRLRLI